MGGDRGGPRIIKNETAYGSLRSQGRRGEGGAQRRVFSFGCLKFESSRARHPVSSRRTQGPITTGSGCWARSLDSVAQHKRHGVWVPAFAGKTRGGWGAEARFFLWLFEI